MQRRSHFVLYLILHHMSDDLTIVNICHLGCFFFVIVKINENIHSSMCYALESPSQITNITEICFCHIQSMFIICLSYKTEYKIPECDFL